MSLDFLLEDKLQFCAICGYPLRVRTNAKTGGNFLGCSRWPHCPFTLPFGVWNKHPEMLQAEFYISPLNRRVMEHADSLGNYEGSRQVVNRVDGRSKE